ncbi:OPT-domain-containing protein [Mycena epipterygia]|nr:OPT-domain-containing protein [Mycena epipterygia]
MYDRWRLTSSPHPDQARSPQGINKTLHDLISWGKPWTSKWLSGGSWKRYIQTLVSFLGAYIIVTTLVIPRSASQLIVAASRYLFDTALNEKPEEYQRLHEELKIEAVMITIDSPYAEVRAVVDNHDNIHLPAATFRTWVIGSIFVCLGFPSISLGPNLLPITRHTTFGYTWSLNPCVSSMIHNFYDSEGLHRSGRFNQKEHMLITVSCRANVGFGCPSIARWLTVHSTQIVWVQYLPIYFNQPWARSFGYQIMIALSTNLMGYGLAGITRRFIVYPAYAIWAFHNNKVTVANGWRISRLRWFIYCFCSMLVYFFFPDFIFQALSVFNWMTWISPTNVNLAAITGNFGLGLNPLPTLDWNQFFTLFTVPIIAALWYSNTWQTGYLPINTNVVFDNTGKQYNVTRVIGSDTLFNQTLYEKYSPAYLSASYILLYGVFFAVYTATLSHAVLYHRREILHGLRSIFSRRETSELHKCIHVRLIESYEEIREWQYGIVLLFAIALGAYPTQTSPAVVLYGVGIMAGLYPEIHIPQSTTNVEVTLNVLGEMLGGLWFPGNAVAMNYFKSYGFVTTSQTISFASDLKLAHYCHISPRLTFWAQIYATIISSFLCTAILQFQMTKIPAVCTPEQARHFTCPNINTFFTARFVGTLGPKRMFGTSGIYNNLLWCFLIGAILPVPFYFLRKRVKALEYFHLPVMANVWPAVPVAYLFNVFIKKRYTLWWSKYNYITTTAFSTAIAICAIIIYFALEWPGAQIIWSGNIRPFTGCDAMQCSRLLLPDHGFFGPGVGQFH